MARSEKKKETFSYVQPNARNVMLVGNFTDWEQHPIELKKQKDGTWRTTVTLEPGEYEYRFLVDGEWRDDATCPMRKPNPFGEANCVREVK
jgi:1,4-alpha-glucan branching enzyme